MKNKEGSRRGTSPLVRKVKLFLIIFKKLEIPSSGMHCPPEVDENNHLKKKFLRNLPLLR